MKNLTNVQNGMTTEEQMARVEKCSALGLCFISLKELVFKSASDKPVDKYKHEKDPMKATNVWFNGIEVAVAQKYVMQ